MWFSGPNRHFVCKKDLEKTGDLADKNCMGKGPRSPGSFSAIPMIVYSHYHSVPRSDSTTSIIWVTVKSDSRPKKLFNFKNVLKSRFLVEKAGGRGKTSHFETFSS